MTNELHWQDATEIARRIRSGELTAAQALNHFLARIERINPIINCIVAIDEAGARARAAEADAALARGEIWGPLHGVPMTVKDTLEVVGMACTAGSEILKDHYPTRNATTVQNLIDAGAIIFGKTNVPPFAADLQTANTLHGTTRNPWNHERLSGGSSGGSAAALAAGLTALELGSDIGGSSRNPAHYNNVFGMRPSWGTLSGIGHIPGMPGALTIDDFGTPGPMARSARDLRLAFDIVRGGEPRFGYAGKMTLPEAPAVDVANLKVALWMDDRIAPVDASVRKVHEAALETLRQAGLVHAEEARPDFDPLEAYNLYIRMGGAITGADTPEEEREKLRQQLAEAEARGDTDPGLERIRGVLMTFAQWQRENHKRGIIRTKWAEFFKTYDVMLSPIMSVAALEHGENFFMRTIRINGQPAAGRDQLYWSAHQVVANLPCIVFPAGFTDEGMPVGLQLTAPYLEDHKAIAVAEALAAILGFAFRHPIDADVASLSYEQGIAAQAEPPHSVANAR